MSSKRGFFSKRNKTEDRSTEPSSQHKVVEIQPKTIPHFILTFTTEQHLLYSDELKAELAKKLNELPPIQTGEVNIFPFEADTLPTGGYYVKVFIRNGGDLELDFALQSIPLFLLDASGEKVAGGVFKPQEFESIAFGEARFWTFAWRPEEVLKPNADLSSFSVAFQ
jgi:SLAP domain-containing protein